MSVGLAWCKSYAKLASLAAKPPGKGWGALRAEEVRVLLGSAPIERLPPLAGLTEMRERLRQRCPMILDVARLDEEVLGTPRPPAVAGMMGADVDVNEEEVAAVVAAVEEAVEEVALAAGEAAAGGGAAEPQPSRMVGWSSQGAHLLAARAELGGRGGSCGLGQCARQAPAPAHLRRVLAPAREASGRRRRRHGHRARMLLRWRRAEKWLKSCARDVLQRGPACPGAPAGAIEA